MIKSPNDIDNQETPRNLYLMSNWKNFFKPKTQDADANDKKRRPSKWRPATQPNKKTKKYRSRAEWQKDFSKGFRGE